MSDILQRFAAFFLLIAALPLMIFIALILACSGSPVFFKSERIGLKKCKFVIYKFATMRSWNAEQLAMYLAKHPEAAAEWKNNRKLTDDPRLLFVGKLLRRLSFDELPQLWNVVKGDMNLVGPRPIVAEEDVLYGKYSDLLHSIKPGMTGLWQVSGRNLLNYHRRIAINIYYVKHRSFAMDLWILYRTVWSVLGGRGAY